jgi:hypothetical protein
VAKRKITVTVDKELIDAVHAMGTSSLSSVVNAALAGEVDRRARARALESLLAEWDASFGPVSTEAAQEAAVAFEDLDGVDGGRADGVERPRQGAA